LVKNFTFFLGFAVFSAMGQSTSQVQKLSAELAAKDPFAQVNVIVQWKHKPTEANQLKVLSRGGLIRQRYSAITAGAYSMSAAAIQELANDPDVEYIAPDRPVHAKLDYTAAAVNAAAAWSSNLTGSGIGIALIDSGLNPNTDLSGRIVYNQDFTLTATTMATAILSGTSSSSGSGATVTSTAVGKTSLIGPDLYGHGQHVAGILAGNGTLSSCSNCNRLLKGIAPGANLINLRVLDANGAGTDSEVIAAIDTAIALAPTYNIRIINLSLGRPVYESYTKDPLCLAVEQAWKAGIVVVVAAGNDGRDNSFGTSGYGTIDAPGNDPYAITVGAMKTEGTYTRTDDLIASYSSKGPTLVDAVVKPDLVAPGNLVVSLLASPSDTLATQTPGNIMPKSYYQNGNSQKPSNVFFQLSGTSMATPVVSAAAALLLHANPNMTPDQIKARLMLTAYKTFPTSSVATDPTTGQTYLSYYDVFTVGAGYLDIEAALGNTSLAQGTALSPTAVYNSATGAIGIVSNASAVWNLNSVWGVQSVYDMRSVWGVNSIDSQQTIWGLNSVWGVNSVWSQNSVWGANSIWGANSVWGVGVSLNGPAAQAMSNGVPLTPSATTTAQTTSLSVAPFGEN
jgi:serine protease AprX